MAVETKSAPLGDVTGPLRVALRERMQAQATSFRMRMVQLEEELEVATANWNAAVGAVQTLDHLDSKVTQMLRPKEPEASDGPASTQSRGKTAAKVSIKPEPEPEPAPVVGKKE